MSDETKQGDTEVVARAAAELVAQLVGDLITLGRQSSRAFIAVVLPGGMNLPITQGTVLVSNGGGDPAGELAELMFARGGRPAAFVALTQADQNHLEVRVMPLKWGASLTGGHGYETAPEYLAALADYFQGPISPEKGDSA